jgi:cytochrome c oxidase subunit 4
MKDERGDGMTDETSSSADGESGTSAVPFSRYAGTYLALVLLATGSLVLSRLHLGGLSVALLIAAAKAILVLWFFMHLSTQSASSRLAVLAAVVMIGTLVALTALDVETRHTFPAHTQPPPSSGFYERSSR